MAHMAFYRAIAAPMILFALVFCMEFFPVVPQTPTGSPLSAPVAQLPPPAVAQLPPPAAAETPLPLPDPTPVVLVPVAAEVPVPQPTAGALQPQPQVTNMIESLRDAGQFGAIAGLLDGLQMKSLTPMTTWLLPNDEAFSGSNYPKNITKFLDYHVIRELLPFSRLLTLSPGTRIPTFLGAETCVVTNNHQLNFSIDNAVVIVPDLYSDSTVAVHGVNAVLDNTIFNGIALPPTLLPSPTVGTPSTSPGVSSPVPLSPVSSRTTPGPSLSNVTHSAAQYGVSAIPSFFMALVSNPILIALAFLL